MPMALTPGALHAPQTTSTATPTTPLFKRGLRNTFLRGVRLLGSGRRQMVGPAYTNPIKHHAVGLNVSIGCGGVPVYPGDIVVGDAEGVVVIPHEIAEAIASEATAQTRFKNFVTEQVLAGRGVCDLYPPTDPADDGQFKAWCAAKG